jgi:hypothetical protein
MSSESTPVLSRAIIKFEKFMTELERLGHDHPVLKPWTDIGVHWATKYYIRMDDTKAYVVSMCKFLYRRITALTPTLLFSPQSLCTLHMDQKAMGNPVYSECEGDYFGAREYNVLFHPYPSYNLCRCASTVIRRHWVLRL